MQTMSTLNSDAESIENRNYIKQLVSFALHYWSYGENKRKSLSTSKP